MPLEQAAWSYLSIIWRLLDDPREAWLADYDKLVMPMDIEAPPGFANTQLFMAELASDLEALHTTQHHPLEQSLREGTQTRGLLFNRRIPTVQALANQLKTQIEFWLASLPVDEAPVPRPQHQAIALRRFLVGAAALRRLSHQPYPPHGVDQLGAVCGSSGRSCEAARRVKRSGGADLRCAGRSARARPCPAPGRGAARRTAGDLPVLLLARDNALRE